MRVCKRCRELGYMCLACASLLLGVSGHDLHATTRIKSRGLRAKCGP
jgi:hypothetical protein